MSQLTEHRKNASDPMPFELPSEIPPHNEGHTVAAWFGMILIMIGVALAAVGLCIKVDLLLIGGLVIAVCGLVGSWILRSAGHGQSRRRS